MASTLQKYTRAAAATGAAFSFIWQGRPSSEHHQHPRTPVPTYSAACEGGSGNDLFYTAAAAAGATAIAAGAGYLLGVVGRGAPTSEARTAQSQRDAALLIRSEVTAKGDAIKANYLRARHLPGSPHEHVEANDLPRCPNNGWGVFQDRDDGVIYVGEFKNGNFDGQGEYAQEYLPGAPDAYPSVRRTSIRRRSLTFTGQLDGLTWEGILVDDQGAPEAAASDGDGNGDTELQSVYVGSTHGTTKHGYGSQLGVLYDGTWYVYTGQFVDGFFDGAGVYMNHAGYEMNAVWDKGKPQSGEWVRVDPDEFVESGNIVDGVCVPNAFKK